MTEEKTKINWSNYCATDDNRNQCGENCMIFFVCKIKTPQTKLKKKLEEEVDYKKVGDLSNLDFVRIINKIFREDFIE